MVQVWSSESPINHRSFSDHEALIMKLFLLREDREQLRPEIVGTSARIQAVVARKDTSLAVLALRGKGEAKCADEGHQLAAVRFATY